MSTPYKDILDRAIFRFSDLKLARMNEVDQYFILQKYLESAVSDFQSKCAVDLTQRVESQHTDVAYDGISDYASVGSAASDLSDGFVEDLSGEEQEILALGVAYYWLSAQILNSELLKNKLSTKDYQYFSPANLMREIQTLRDSVRKEYRDRIVRYTYDHGDLAMEGNI